MDLVEIEVYHFEGWAMACAGWRMMEV
jgi:hypothetical protein